MFENICNFVPHRDYTDSIHIINFVLEANPDVYSSLKSYSTYRVHYVYSGNGILHTLGNLRSIRKGDIFFTFPGMSFYIEGSDNFSYTYISFLGSRANMLMECVGISASNHFFENCLETESMWQHGILSVSEMCDIASESILLYILSYIGNKNTSHKSSKSIQDNTAFRIKKYIDDNFTNPELSLRFMSKSINYNPKYISTVFKKQFGIGVSEYLTTIRHQHACTLMHQGFTNVNDISSCCGYSDASYFSKIFKKHLGHSPVEYIKSLHNSSEK